MLFAVSAGGLFDDVLVGVGNGPDCVVEGSTSLYAYKVKFRAPVLSTTTGSFKKANVFVLSSYLFVKSFEEFSFGHHGSRFHSQSRRHAHTRGAAA